MAGGLANIRHIVVLMLENRSFDHLLGFDSGTLGVDGLTGTESNPLVPADPASPRVTVSSDAHFTGDFTRTLPNGSTVQIDAGHGFEDTSLQIFGPPNGSAPGLPRNQGFVASYAQQPNSSADFAGRVMKCFAPASLPVLTALAAEFTVCDRWFSSVPGPTWPNRLFVHAASSDGLVVHKKKLYGMQTIYDGLWGIGKSTRIYAGDIAQSLLLKHLLFSGVFHSMAGFYSDVNKGKLPDYSFIEPDYFGGDANDQHPPHDVAAGETLIADVYEAIRRSAYWETTLLIVLWDEHGGLYDHVTPPAAVPPNGKTSTSPPFAFDRLGVRVPAVLVSPWIPKGTVDHTEYDHTSIITTVRKCFNVPEPLTARDAVAQPVDRTLTLDTPRQDAPLRLPRPIRVRTAARRAAAGPKRAARMTDPPLSDLQKQLLDLADLVRDTHARAGIAPARPLRAAAARRRPATELPAKAYVSAIYQEQVAVSHALNGADGTTRRPGRAPATTRKSAKKVTGRPAKTTKKSTKKPAKKRAKKPAKKRAKKPSAR